MSRVAVTPSGPPEDRPLEEHRKDRMRHQVAVQEPFVLSAKSSGYRRFILGMSTANFKVKSSYSFWAIVSVLLAPPDPVLPGTVLDLIELFGRWLCGTWVVLLL